ncbi:DMT family transporter [Agrobacterium rosae]|uniref:Multidrug efflux SMR transporter n=1 Tax=Agrobacterium rosae TaxID=1972867 RepID=A0AAE5S0E1_9HYPH|nr:multidrug efflux SMR transporter [Agrobacterium rosae]KAA3513255.1 QacE family quaternary ammonium compound efflux SMR transporter [Agrobacterium rosae]KAA3521261.1 QacE family quaternary ammonium compound efflux SMR transporter [Agrobacterium rosae]MCM2432908.1 multidrug efflux SMR transporter [Agrobacterium rosae]MDX8328022.1 multidrug efflux SMR transporter [Agrobacterium rosae]MQB48134.1 QacE family quaternary ammonium compound efflux SMR transporter [Agrobacterium rosae]
MNSVTLTYAALVAAIVCEVIGTSFLQQSQQFTRWVPTLLMAVFYGAAFYLLSITLRTIPVGVAYAIWSGLGIVLISAVGYVFFRQTLDLAAMIGLGLIIAGVLVVNLFSKTVGH